MPLIKYQTRNFSKADCYCRHSEPKPQKTVILTDSKAAPPALSSDNFDQTISQLLIDTLLLLQESTVVLQITLASCWIQVRREQI